MSKLNKMIECLIEDMTTQELWHVVFNKMTNPAKRQLIQELLNKELGPISPIDGYLYINNDD